MSEPTSSSPRASRLAVLLFGALLAVALWTLTRGWHASILDRHDFRQVQTALSIHWLKETGFKPDYETPLFGPPWSIPMEFPVYQAVVAKLSGTLDTGTETTGRAVSVGFFLATLPAVFLLGGALGLTGHRRLWPVAAVLMAPVYLFYARTLMIETTALCFSVWFLYALARTVRDNCVRCAVGATVFAVLAALAKVTTFLAFAPAAGLIALWFWLPRWRQRHAAPAGLVRIPLLTAVPVVAALAASLWWVGYADALKDANPFSGFLTSRELSAWNWGTPEQRLSPAFWAGLGQSLTHYVFSEASLTVVLVALACAGPAQRRIAAWGLALFLAGPLLFSNLYQRHDYYYCANAVFLLAAAGVALAGAWDNPRLPRALRLLLPLLFIGGQWLGYQRTFGDYTRRELPQAPGIASVIRETVPPDGVVLIYGWEWYAAIPYYAQRRAVMVLGGREDDLDALDNIMDRLAPFRISAMLVHNPSLQRSAEFIRSRTDRFGLAPTSLATSEAGDLYVAGDVLVSAARALRDRDLGDVVLNVDFESMVEEPALEDHPVASLALPLFQPQPVRARAMHGFVPGEHEGQPTLMAHPVSELHFVAPAGSTRIVADVGIFPQAYAPDAPSVTDGVTIEIIERRPNGVRRILLRRTLDPVANESDRGTQTVELDAGPFEGALIFRTTPGPAGRYNNDWAYWSRIEIR